MEKRIFLIVLIFTSLYMLLPWIITRIMGIGVVRRFQGNRQLALTFDDGPHPEYTPQLLDLLKKHNMKATFFVLASRAEQYPELLLRMHEEGHQIGVHNYDHKSNWLMLPWNVKRRQVDRSADIIERITGCRPTCYRPPWGMLNLTDLFLLKDYTIVLWSVMTGDWRSKVAEKRLKNSMLEGLKDGAIVLLHDSGDTLGANRDAPRYMLQALEEVLEELQRQSWATVRIDELMTAAATPAHNSRRLLLAFWMLWERCFATFFNIIPVDQSNPLLKVRVREYRGSQPIQLEDGEQICKGDRIAELHLDNKLLYRLGSSSRNSVHLAIQLIRRTEVLLPQLLLLMQNDPQYRDVKGLYGISIIHRGTRQLGFTVLDLPEGFFSKLTHYYLRFLLYVIHPQGTERLKSRSELLTPKIIAISKKELENRYAA
ncbi:polysaccharide deacetylase family protein [Paenibacillus senegalensis]|uniref:polysaccharide deacetylase family protein n=1 Tax=Paenibacillus senegalensis TaxID=1465766 RepID=UPI00031BC02E|nr:polysaccharide deacetylase family protein [Paenibacillus senegalensis]